MTMETFIPMAKNALGFFAFTTIELMVLFVGISFIVGVIQEFVPPEKIKSLLSAKRGRGYFIGAGLGALTPFCSCSTIPIMVGLLKAQAGFGPTLAFLFSSPLVNPIIVGLFFMAFGLKATVVYSILALLMAVTISYLLEKSNFQRFIKWDAIGENQQSCCSSSKPATPIAAESVKAGCCGPIVPEPALSCCASAGDVQVAGCCGPVPASSAVIAVESGRWARIFKEAVQQFRTFLPYIVFGVAIGALAYGFVPKELIVKYAGPDNPFAIPIAAIIGVPLYVRVETMIPITVALIGKGMSLGAVVALVIGGAGASIPEVVMLRRIFKGPLLGAFLAAILSIAVASGLIFNAVFQV
jgi:uncharacterized membrane protein YraQ (UPF0718 family)